MNIKPLLLSIVLVSTPLTVFAEMVNINQASVSTLQHYLKGIGEKKAESIVVYRTEHKEFKSLDEIMKVKGIGKGIYKNIKADLSLTEGKVAFVKANKMPKKVKVKVKDQVKNVIVDGDAPPVKASVDVLTKVVEPVKIKIKKQVPKPVVAKIDMK